MKKWMLSCKEATSLMSKREEGRLTTKERIMLQFHLLMCDFCKIFEKQSNFISKAAKKLENSSILPDSDKEKITNSLKRQ